MPKRTDIQSILILGSGPIVIGQACEFDYSGTQAVRALKEEGYKIILVNSNPATIMTDPDLADRTYIEPLTPDWVERVVDREKPDALLPTMGGQTALNIAMTLHESGVLEKYGVELIGADARSIRLTIEIAPGFARYVARKGSITVDGVSLTVNEVSGNAFEVNIIPHTAEATIIGDYTVGTSTNIEVDLLARYIERLIAKDDDGVSMEFLRANGYV